MHSMGKLQDADIQPHGTVPVSRQLPQSGARGECLGTCRRNPVPPSNSSEPTAGVAPGIEEEQVVAQVYIVTRNRVKEIEAGPCMDVLPRPRHSVWTVQSLH